MERTELPAIYRNSDSAAGIHQRNYFRLLIVQYICLFAASVATIGNGLFPSREAGFFYVAAIIVAILSQIGLAITRPDQKWYSSRALAESLMTLSWRFTMGADPFPREMEPNEAKIVFKRRIDQLLLPHRTDPSMLLDGMEHGDLVTSRMVTLRTADVTRRLSEYLTKRVKGQRNWYVQKARRNRISARIVAVITVVTYLVAATFGVLQLVDSTTVHLWATEPVLLFAASLIGWSQAKRYSELAASYTLTAHEISALISMFSEDMDEQTFEKFVVEAEFAFSREHTQWAARA